MELLFRLAFTGNGRGCRSTDGIAVPDKTLGFIEPCPPVFFPKSFGRGHFVAAIEKPDDGLQVPCRRSIVLALEGRLVLQLEINCVTLGAMRRGDFCQKTV